MSLPRSCLFSWLAFCYKHFAPNGAKTAHEFLRSLRVGPLLQPFNFF